MRWRILCLNSKNKWNLSCKFLPICPQLFFLSPTSSCLFIRTFLAVCYSRIRGRIARVADSIRSPEGDVPPDPPPELIQTHQTLMVLLGQYEHLSKRISGMPCQEGGNQASVQGAVARSAATFLTKEMLKVQVSPPLFHPPSPPSSIPLLLSSLLWG